MEVEVGVAHGQQPHGLHASPPLLLVGHWDLLKAAQPVQLVLLEIAASKYQIIRNFFSPDDRIHPGHRGNLVNIFAGSTKVPSFETVPPHPISSHEVFRDFVKAARHGFELNPFENHLRGILPLHYIAWSRPHESQRFTAKIF